MSGGDVWLLESGTQTSGESVIIPGLAYLIPHSSGNISYLQARRWDNSGTTQLRLRTYNNGSLTEAMHIDHLGRVGIGTISPMDKIEIMNGNLRIEDVDGKGVLIRQADGNRWGRVSITKTSGTGAGTGNTLMLDAKNDYGSQYNQRILLRTAGTDRVVVEHDGKVGIGTTSPQYKLHVNGQVLANNISVTSDEKLKKNIRGYDQGLALVKQINPVKYQYKPKKLKRAEIDTVSYKETIIEETETDNREYIGVVAQEIQQISPELVEGFLNEDGEELLSVNLSAFTFILINAVKEQQALIEELQLKVAALEK